MGRVSERGLQKNACDSYTQVCAEQRNHLQKTERFHFRVVSTVDVLFALSATGTTVTGDFPTPSKNTQGIL